jgi:hypothetical protein
MIQHDRSVKTDLYRVEFICIFVYLAHRLYHLFVTFDGDVNHRLHMPRSSPHFPPVSPVPAATLRALAARRLFARDTVKQENRRKQEQHFALADER